jgi:predicted 3-demethylubiquinone-9 3-methyltransferase (glyoxalase superfamily)
LTGLLPAANVKGTTSKQGVVMATITPFIWFDDDLEQAIDFYAGIFPDAKFIDEQRTDNGDLFYGTFTLAGRTFSG